MVQGCLPSPARPRREPRPKQGCWTSSALNELAALPAPRAKRAPCHWTTAWPTAPSGGRHGWGASHASEQCWTWSAATFLWFLPSAACPFHQASSKASIEEGHDDCRQPTKEAKRPPESNPITTLSQECGLAAQPADLRPSPPLSSFPPRASHASEQAPDCGRLSSSCSPTRATK
jgi:hypothetical protein